MAGARILRPALQTRVAELVSRGAATPPLVEWAGVWAEWVEWVGWVRGSRQGTRGPEVTGEDWDRLAANPKYLHIDQSANQFVVSNDSDESHTFYPDGKKHDDKDVDGKKISTKSQWDKDSFVAETKLSHSRKITETYQLSEGGKHLTVTTRFEDPSLSQPLTIQRVYDAGKAPAN